MKKFDSMELYKYPKYYCKPYTIDKAKNKLFKGSDTKNLNCSDKALQYDTMSDEIKESFVIACMKIVLENWKNHEELINMHNKVYGFDLIKEFNNLIFKE